MKEDMERQCSMYFETPETMQTIVQVVYINCDSRTFTKTLVISYCRLPLLQFYYDKYRTGAERMLGDFHRKYNFRIEARKVEIFEVRIDNY